MGVTGKGGQVPFLHADYLSFVNNPQPKEEEEKIRLSVVKGNPYGSDSWSTSIIKKFSIESTVRLPWRPKKGT